MQESLKALKLQAQLCMCRAGAVHAASSEDREPSNANSMAESIDKKPWFPDQNTERSWYVGEEARMCLHG